MRDFDLTLSRHFTLRELLITEHRDIDNTPPAAIVDRLRWLCNDFLEALRGRFGPLRVTSGYRCAALNTTIGGAPDSAHTYGCAADLQALDGWTPEDMARWVALSSGLPFDQVIDEGNATAAWLHLGALRPYHEPAPRRQALRFRSGSYSQLQLLPPAAGRVAGT